MRVQIIRRNDTKILSGLHSAMKTDYLELWHWSSQPNIGTIYTVKLTIYVTVPPSGPKDKVGQRLTDSLYMTEVQNTSSLMGVCGTPGLGTEALTKLVCFRESTVTVAANNV